MKKLQHTTVAPMAAGISYFLVILANRFLAVGFEEAAAVAALTAIVGPVIQAIKNHIEANRNE